MAGTAHDMLCHPLNHGAGATPHLAVGLAVAVAVGVAVAVAVAVAAPRGQGLVRIVGAQRACDARPLYVVHTGE